MGLASRSLSQTVSASPLVLHSATTCHLIPLLPNWLVEPSRPPSRSRAWNRKGCLYSAAEWNIRPKTGVSGHPPTLSYRSGDQKLHEGRSHLCSTHPCIKELIQFQEHRKCSILIYYHTESTEFSMPQLLIFPWWLCLVTRILQPRELLVAYLCICLFFYCLFSPIECKHYGQMTVSFTNVIVNY